MDPLAVSQAGESQVITNYVILKFKNKTSTF